MCSAAAFLALTMGSAAAGGWRDYQIIMWQTETPPAYAALRELGVTVGAVEVDRATGLFSAKTRDLLERAGLGFYVENIATDFYAPYHRYDDTRPVNWKFRELKERHREAPRDHSVFVRDPSLSDPAWLARIAGQLQGNVRALAADRPLYFNLADEPGIADLSAYWDFDFSASSLAGMRAWLEETYGTLDALNAEWGTKFATWDAVVPETTDEAIARHDGNNAGWADFKAWMDVAFASAIAAGSNAIHAADPAARSAIEGGQIPGGGGWDYARLAGTVDVMELYDYGDNVALVRSFAPKTVLLTTSFGEGLGEAHRIWRELLRGTRGLVLWDENHGFVAPDGTLGPRGREMAPLFAELRGGLAALLLAGERHTDPVAILYSQESLRTQWLLDRRGEWGNWAERTASSEYADDAVRVAMRRYVGALEHGGIEPVYITSDAIERGALSDGRYRVLVLPHVIALSPKAAAEVRAFVARGGTVIADIEPGLYDQHSRKLAQPPMEDLLARTPGPAQGRGVLASGDALAPILAAVGVVPPFPVHNSAGAAATDVETYVFRFGDATVVALLRDAPADAKTPPAAETVTLALPRAAFAFDVRARWPLGRSDHVTLSLDPFAPTIVALTDAALPAPEIAGPDHIARGGTAEFPIRSSASVDVAHVEVRMPSGARVALPSDNFLAEAGTATFRLTVVKDAPPGRWSIAVTDILSGAAAKTSVEVGDP